MLNITLIGLHLSTPLPANSCG